MADPVNRRRLGLTEQLRLLELAEKMSGVGHWRYDPIEGRVDWSDQVFVICGVDPQSFDHQYGNALALYHPEDQPEVDRLMTRAVTTGAGFDFQFRLLRSGEVRHVACTADCERGADGAVTAVLGVFQDVTDHVVALKAAEIAREDAEEKARRASVAEKIAGLGHWRISIPNRTLTWSDQMYVIHGHSPSEPPGVDLFSRMIHPGDQARATLRLEQDLRGVQADRPLDLRIIRPNGEVRWVLVDTTVERDAQGRPIALMGTLMDITEQRLAERRIEESEARYRLITENAHDLVISYTPDAVLTYVSPSIVSLLGYQPDEVIGATGERLIHLEDRDLCRQGFIAAIKGDDVGNRDYRLVRKDGSIVWVEARPRAILDPATGAIICVTDVVRDVTARREAEAALVASEERYRLLSDNASDILAQCTFEGVITFVSPGCRQTLGFDGGELLGRRWIDLIHTDDRAGVLTYFEDLVAEGAAARGMPFQFRAQRKDGVWVWLEGQPTIFFDAAGEPVLIQDVLRDITTRKSLEIALDQARIAAQAASNVKSEFLSNMSHELRTPLTSIVGFTSILEEEPTLSELGVRAVSRVASSAAALLSIVNDILDFSKLEAGRFAVAPRPVDVVGLLQDAVASMELQARDKGLTLTLATDPSLPERVWLDDARVRQIAVNLLSNGVKFTAAGGVALRAAYLHPQRRLRCEVEDTGSGVPADQADRLFKRFSQLDGSPTRAHGGTGLGLAICRGLIEAMGGDIGVTNGPAKGSIFWFELPSEPADGDERLVGAPPTALPRPGLRVLVAGYGAGAWIPKTLTPLGIDVVEARPDATLLPVAESSLFDLILLTSPIDQTILSVVQALRDGCGPNDLTPVLALSDDPERLRPADAELDGYVPGPLGAEALVSLVDRWTRPQARA